MHPDAHPTVIVWGVRHLHSTAIQDDTYYGESSEVTERGLQQRSHLVQEIKKLRPDAILCSPAVRATTILKDSGIDCPLIPEPAIGEWPRATVMLGKPNSSLRVQRYLDSRIRRFGSDVSFRGEESFKVTAELMELISMRLSILGSQGRKRIVMLSHGNRMRQFLAWAMADGDPDAFIYQFKLLYRKFGIDPASIMPPMWHGPFFRDNRRGWNCDLGITRHLPFDLRDSEI